MARLLLQLTQIRACVALMAGWLVPPHRPSLQAEQLTALGVSTRSLNEDIRLRAVGTVYTNVSFLAPDRIIPQV